MIYLPDKITSCCFSGHRSAKLPWGNDEYSPLCVRLKEEIAKAVAGLIGDGYRHFICGMAQGSDIYFAEAVIENIKNNTEISLEAAIPFEGHADSLSDEASCRYENILSYCCCISVFSEKYDMQCMQLRNMYMVDSSSAIVSVFDGQSGGTLSTLKYAKRRGLLVVGLPVPGAGDGIL